MNIIRIGTRGSKLALTQAKSIYDSLVAVNRDIEIEIVTISTKGDKDRKSPLADIGGTGVFTKRIENELLNYNIDIAVHSAKDLPSVMTAGLTIGAIPKREAVEDVLISKDNASLDDLKQGAVIGTGSPRRQAMILNYRQDFFIEEIRGNVETRLNKLDSGFYDAIIMAKAGLNRLGLQNRVSQTLPLDSFLPAPGQGALVAQIREDEGELKTLLENIDDNDTRRCLTAERLLLQKLNAGCSAAVGGLASIENDDLILKAAVLDKTGKKRLYAMDKSDNINNDKTMVSSIAEKLFSQGAKELIG